MNPQLTEEALFEAPARLHPRILLVDDEPVVLSVTTTILHRSNYRVIQVRSGEAAIERLQSEAFDLIMTDFRMPGKSGIDVVLAARQAHPRIPVVLMTGRIDDVPPWMRWGESAVPIILKPFLMVELLRVVNHALLTRKSA